MSRGTLRAREVGDGPVNLTASSRPAPELSDIDGWVNSTPMTISSLRGRVVFLDFWTFSCVNCVRTIPYVNDLHTRFSQRGLVVIGVHTPEFEHERDASRVREAVVRLKIRYPVALDSRNTTWKLYGNMYWPRQTIIDSAGEVRYEHIGEGGYEEIEAQVEGMLRVAEAQRRSASRGSSP